MIDRRTFLIAGAALAGGCATRSPPDPAVAVRLEEIRSGLGAGARLGIAGLDTGSGRRIGFDADSRYAMCSTFKVALAAAILAEVGRGALTLDQELAVSRADLVEYAPVVTANLDRGRITVEALCAAIVEVSDNAAANILLKRIGGPAGLTAFIRRCGDDVIRLDRMETELNSNIPGDVRDTTSPAAMLGLMRALLLGKVLAPEARARLAGWMERASTGLTRLRAGFPPGWRAGDKTGTGNGANNDIAIVWPPERSPILVASYIDAPEAPNESRNAAHAAVARLVAETFA